MLLDILGFILFLFVAPFLVFAIVATEIALGIERMFHIPTLVGAVSFAGLFFISYGHMVPEKNDMPFQSIVVVLLDSIGQAHFLGQPLPYFFALCAAAFLTLSIILRVRTPAHA